MADLRKIALVMSLIVGVLSLKLFKSLGSLKASFEEGKDRKISVESKYQVYGLMVCYMIISSAVSRYLFPQAAQQPFSFWKFILKSSAAVLIFKLSIFIFDVLQPLW